MTASEPIITCPHCRAEIKLTESLAAPLIAATRQEFEQQLARKDAEVSERLQALQQQKELLDQQRAQLQEQLAQRLEQERAKLAAEETKKARERARLELDEKTREATELKELLAEREHKLAEAQRAQAALLRKERELDAAKREMELTIEKQVQAGLAAARQQAGKEAEESLKLKLQEKEQIISAMQKQIEELKQRAEQGSQQLQGEVQELDLEQQLRAQFPHDIIEAVPKGVHGGDILQRVTGPHGSLCGTILWESKRTKNYMPSWLPKLREDQRNAKAELALLVTQALPNGVDTFLHR